MKISTVVRGALLYQVPVVSTKRCRTRLLKASDECVYEILGAYVRIHIFVWLTYVLFVSLLARPLSNESRWGTQMAMMHAHHAYRLLTCAALLAQARCPLP